MSLPKTFKRAKFTEKGAPLTIEEAKLEQPSRNQILVKVEACGVCHSDSFAQSNNFGVGL